MDEGTGHRYKAITLASPLGTTVIVYDRSIIVVGACRIAPRSSLGALAELIWASQGSSRVGIAGASVTGACKRKEFGQCRLAVCLCATVPTGLIEVLGTQPVT